MILTTIAYILLSISVIGLGAPLFRVLYQKQASAGSEPANLLMVTMLGLAVLGSIANLLNFVTPISSLVAVLLLILGEVSLFVVRKFVWNRVLEAWPWSPLSLLLLCLGLFTGVAWATCQSIPAYDVGLYYLQTVRWMQQAVLPWGLANLHGRLGFNSIWFSVAAATGAPGLQDRVLLVINGILFAAYGMAIVKGMAQAVNHGISLHRIFLIVSCIPWFVLLDRQILLDSAAPDMVIALLGLTSAYLSIRDLESKSDSTFYLAMTAFVGILGVAVKLSALPLLVAPAALTLRRAVRVCGRPGCLWRGHRRSILWIAGISALIWLPWAARGLMLSGCLAYPSTVGCFPGLPWAVPIPLVRSESLWIRSWARQPGVVPELVLGNWNWLLPWLHRFATQYEIRVMLILALLGALGWLVAILRHHRPRIGHYAVVALGPLIGTAFWFFSAPDTRFGLAYLWPIALLILATGANELRLGLALSPNVYSRRTLLALCVLICVACVPVALQYYKGLDGQALLVWPDNTPRIEVQENRTSSGVGIWTPVSGDQCWDSPLPCTPSLRPSLEVELGADGLPKRWRDTHAR